MAEHKKPVWKTINLVPTSRDIRAVFYQTEDPFIVQFPIVAWATQQKISDRNDTRVVGIMAAGEECDPPNDYSDFKCYCTPKTLKENVEAWIAHSKQRALNLAAYRERSELAQELNKSKEK